ncbi:VanW family protein [Bacilliculturomica massiliensis]|uniref:VanW family protein n=1 Tax=Bacilliculturomica massiliensis TaxID=1917867 RepID=UPI0010300EAB|nr:VanW family protein [Bacilliculturomica massiliensis]
MKRKRVTEMVPGLLPLRKKQRRACFYLKMALDRNHYAGEIQREPLENSIFSASSTVINRNSGFDIQYQYNKAYNLEVASKPVSGVLIRPGETFSFWRLLKDADAQTPYKEALALHEGEMSTVEGGGLCQLSNLLFWMFLHTPLTIVERHSHSTEFFSGAVCGMPEGADASVAEGWKDLKVRNETQNVFQIFVGVREDELCGEIRALYPLNVQYEIYHKNLRYYSVDNDIYRENDVFRKTLSVKSGALLDNARLFHSRSMVKHPLEEGTVVSSEEGHGDNGVHCRLPGKALRI